MSEGDALVVWSELATLRATAMIGPPRALAGLTITNPDKRNALDHAILDGIAEAMPELETRGSRRVASSSPGGKKVSAPGCDIGDIPDEVFAEQAEPSSPSVPPCDRGGGGVPFPTIAAIDGHALGGGLELAVACDLRLAVTGAKLGMPPGKLGLIYSHTGLLKFIDTIGPARTRELFLIGSYIDAKRAEEIGLVNDVVERGTVREDSY